ncbi:MAG: histidine kinase [Anaerolineae bacterium]|nr:histidine kinase [Anaerolineae bacterium]
MGVQAGVGMSHYRNPKVAGQEAANKALEAAGVEKPDFVFMFATVGYNQQDLLKAVREATDGAPLCGCSAEGVIAGSEADESNFAVAVMAISSDQLRFSHGMVTGLKEDPTQAGRAIAEAIQPEMDSDTLALFLFPDGITLNFDRLLAGLEGQLKLDRLLPLVGGTAGDNLAMKRTYQYYNDQVVSDGVAWALLSGQAQIAWAVNHGCVPVGIEHKVTRCEGNVIYEIDDRPALEVVKDYVTEAGIEDWAATVLTLPLGFNVPGNMQDYDEYIIRGMLGGIDDTTGSVTIPTEVSEGMSIWITRRDSEKLAKGVEQIAEEINAQLGEEPAKLVFQFDCAGRGKAFLREQQKLRLLETLRGRIGPDVPWLGFYTFGEISPVGERNYFHNYTVVLTVIY